MFVCYRMVFYYDTLSFSVFLKSFPQKLFVHVIIEIVQRDFNLWRLARVVGVDNKPRNGEVESLRLLQLPEVESPFPRIHRCRGDTVLVAGDFSVIPDHLLLHVLVDERVDDQLVAHEFGGGWLSGAW